MDDLLSGFYESHRLLLLLAALGYVAYWSRSHSALPRHAHVLAGVALLVGIACLALTPPDAPVHRQPLGWVRKGAMLAVFPSLVYVFFIFYGGQPAAYGRASGCSRCGRAHLPDELCEAD